MKLSAAQQTALRELLARKGGSPRIGLSAATVTGLVRKGLVERVPHPEAPGFTKPVLTVAGEAAAIYLESLGS